MEERMLEMEGDNRIEREWRERLQVTFTIQRADPNWKAFI
jgi:hypothetical protein